MLTALLGHVGRPVAPHDLWGAWNGDPLLVAGLALVTCAYARGRPPGRLDARTTRRARAFFGAVAVLAVALLSPLDAVSGALASAHMVQHLLLVGVAAPLLALSAPGSRILRGSPRALRRAAGTRAARRLHRGSGPVAPLRLPAVVAVAHVAVLWGWHAAALYDAALRHPVLHAAEHAAFLVTGVAFWRLLVGPRSPARVSPGLAVLLLFGVSLQGVALALLLTFAETPWYAGYATTTAAWSLDPLTDQQLAGAIMWVPGGLLYLLPALALLVGWLRGLDDGHGRVPALPVGEQPRGAAAWKERTWRGESSMRSWGARAGAEPAGGRRGDRRRDGGVDAGASSASSDGSCADETAGAG